MPQSAVTIALSEKKDNHNKAAKEQSLSIIREHVINLLRSLKTVKISKGTVSLEDQSDQLLEAFNNNDFQTLLSDLASEPRTLQKFKELLWLIKAANFAYFPCYTSDYAHVNRVSLIVLHQTFWSWFRSWYTLDTKSRNLNKLIKHPDFITYLYRRDLGYSWFHSPFKQPLRHFVSACILSLPLMIITGLLVALTLANPVTTLLLSLLPFNIPTILLPFSATWWGAALVAGATSLIAWPLIGLTTFIGESLATTLSYVADRIFYNKATEISVLAYYTLGAFFLVFKIPAFTLYYLVCAPVSSLQNKIGRDAQIVKRHIIESHFFPAAHVLRRSRFTERLADTFYLFNGHAIKRGRILTPTPGLIDLCCLGIPDLSWTLMQLFWQSFNDSEMHPIIIGPCVIVAIFALPINAAKFVLALVLTAAMSPLVTIMHFALWRTAEKHANNVKNISFTSHNNSTEKSGTELFDDNKRLIPFAYDSNNQVVRVNAVNETYGHPVLFKLYYRFFSKSYPQNETLKATSNLKNSTDYNKYSAELEVSSISKDSYYSLLRLNVGECAIPLERDGKLKPLVKALLTDEDFLPQLESDIS